MCCMLIENGAEADVKDGDDLSALMVAVQFGHVDTCKILLTGGKVNILSRYTCSLGLTQLQPQR